MGVDDGEETAGGDGGDDAGGFVDGAVEAGAGGGGCDGGDEGELFVALADVGLIVDAVEDPLAEVAFEMDQEVGDGVFVVGVAVEDLVVG